MLKDGIKFTKIKENFAASAVSMSMHSIILMA